MDEVAKVAGIVVTHVLSNMGSRSPSGRLIALDHFIMERMMLCSYWRGHLFLTGNASAKTTINRLTGYLIYCHDIPHNTDSDREIQWACDHASHWSYHIPHHSEAAELIKM